MNYDNIPQIPQKSVVHFKEFTLDRHEKKKLSKEVKGILLTIITPEQSLDGEILKMYYPDTDENQHPILSLQPFYRLVLETGTNRLGMPVYTTVHTNKYFMLVGLQEIDWKENVIEVQPEIPSQILGFNSYDIGSKFKK